MHRATRQVARRVSTHRASHSRTYLSIRPFHEFSTSAEAAIAYLPTYLALAPGPEPSLYEQYFIGMIQLYNTHCSKQT